MKNDLIANQCFLPFRVVQYCKLGNMITEEKEKYVNLKQIASQSIAELREQVKVLGNETEIQRSIVINKDRCVRVEEVQSNNTDQCRDEG